MSQSTGKRYPVAETFDSIQGEGFYAGVAMSFVRLAGCHIGKRAAVCCFADGRKFACDTDYRSKRVATAAELANEASFEHVCITGGEPLDHDLLPLLGALKRRNKFIHLETSGTIEAPEGIDWITVSPKRDCLDSMLRRANQIKLLVDERFDDASWRERLRRAESQALVYVQPINEVHRIDDENLNRAFALTQVIPSWRLTIQMHKVLQVR